jgi:hypothetical protein
MIRYVADDPGYRAWLLAHPDGWVLNTHRHPKPRYLILHHATCRTINRPADDRVWTGSYTKTCADRRADLEQWARTHGHAEAQPCSLCLPTG